MVYYAKGMASALLHLDGSYTCPDCLTPKTPGIPDFKLEPT